MSETAVFCLRLFVASALGATIGFEREWRAKEAGLRTHFLVALGASLVMIVSKYGFSDLTLPGGGVYPGIRGADPARIAAQVISGISFLGAGVIVLHKRFIMGLTTAATIWTTAAIGLAVGGGMYAVPCVATGLVLLGLESGRLVDKHLGRARREVRVVFTAPDDSSAEPALKALAEAGARLSSYSSTPNGAGVRVHVLLEATTAVSQPDYLLPLLSRLPGIRPETVE
ncbi:MAG: MgtC/SapB family protein [Kiritimatiellae bacterium]|nr:MgtC/SapB family protein [Kiritimatiellia bacterium]MBR1835751.1 MgtC/SapB family protein [Kiritimatiellia bacterium]